MLLVLLLAAVPILVSYAIIRYYKFTSKYPKGPTPLPFIGNFHQVDFRNQHLTYKKYAPNFDGVFTLFSPLPFVVLTTYEAVREAFVEKGDDYAGRAYFGELTDAFTYCKNGGVINSNGDNWREQRRTALSILRDFGMGKNTMEQNVQSSIQDFLDYLDGVKDKNNVNMRWSIQLMVSNIINEVLYGYRYTHDNCERLINYVNDLNKMFADFAEGSLMFLILGLPFLKYIPVLGWHALGKHQANIRRMNRVVEDDVDKALEGFDNDADEPSCFVQAYYQKMKEGSYLNKKQLVATCSDFFLAGQETTSTTLRWSVLYLATNPAAQQKLRDEVLAVVGKDRMPSMQDKTKMPYAQACVLELQRRANILSTNVLHATTTDTTIMGRPVPANTMVMADLNGLLAHGPLYKNPDAFMPERFLTDDGKGLRKDLVEQTIPFMIGKRACAGEALARMELFLGVTALVQRYRLLPSDSGPVDLTPVVNSVILPRDQCLKLERV